MDFIGKYLLDLFTKYCGDRISLNNKARTAESKLKGYIEHLNTDIDDVIRSAYVHWELSFKHQNFKLYFEDPTKIEIPNDFDHKRIQGYFDECADNFNETLRVTIIALLRHINNYAALKKEVLKLSYESKFDEQKSYKFYIESLYIRRYIIALSNDWEHVVLLTLDNHTYEQLVSPLGLPVNINSLRQVVLKELNIQSVNPTLKVGENR